MYYKPEKNSVCADVIPYYKDGSYYLFYLKDYRDPEGYGEGVPWFLLKTKDFVNYQECGEVLPKGDITEQDLFVFTGSVIEKEGKYYLFYTGHNPHKRKQNEPEQAVMLAVSDDCEHFIKTDFMMFAPENYEMHDWRDPYLYEENGTYKMLLAARTKEGPFLKKGLTVVCSSKDLWNWEVEGEFYAPENFYTHECPDLFKIGDWWYLVFSEFSDSTATKYRMTKDLYGEWITPTVDTFDARCFYAAKTVSNGKDRYLIGWISTREKEEDYGSWQWGGNIAVHKLIQNPDGTLSVENPTAVRNQYLSEVKVEINKIHGNVKYEDGVYSLLKGGYSYVLFNEMPNNCRITCKIKMSEIGKNFGFSLRMDEEYNLGYYVKFDPLFNRMCFDRNFRPGDNPFMIDSERYLPTNDDEYHDVEIMIEDSIAIVYVDNVAMSSRMYEYKKGHFGIYVNECGASFKDIHLYVK